MLHFPFRCSDKNYGLISNYPVHVPWPAHFNFLLALLRDVSFRVGIKIAWVSYQCSSTFLVRQTLASLILFGTTNPSSELSHKRWKIEYALLKSTDTNIVSSIMFYSSVEIRTKVGKSLKQRQKFLYSTHGYLRHNLRIPEKHCFRPFHKPLFGTTTTSALQHFCSHERRKAVQCEGLHYPLTSMSAPPPAFIRPLHTPTQTHTHTHYRRSDWGKRSNRNKIATEEGMKNENITTQQQRISGNCHVIYSTKLNCIYSQTSTGSELGENVMCSFVRGVTRFNRLIMFRH